MIVIIVIKIHDAEVLRIATGWHSMKEALVALKRGLEEVG